MGKKSKLVRSYGKILHQALDFRREFMKAIIGGYPATYNANQLAAVAARILSVRQESIRKSVENSIDAIRTEFGFPTGAYVNRLEGLGSTTQLSAVMAYWHAGNLRTKTSTSRDPWSESKKAADAVRVEILRWVEDAYSRDEEEQIIRTFSGITASAAYAFRNGIEESNNQNLDQMVAKSLAASADYCDNTDSWKSLARRWLLYPETRLIRSDAPDITSRDAWALGCLLEDLILHVHGAKTAVSINTPDGAGTLRMWTSSLRSSKHSNGSVLGRSAVAPYSLVGGAVVALDAHFADDKSNPKHNSNSEVEGMPSGVLGYPILIPNGPQGDLNGLSHLFVGLRKDSEKLLLEDQTKQGLIFCFADFMQQKLGGGPTKWWTGLCSFYDNLELEKDLIELMRVPGEASDSKRLVWTVIKSVPSEDVEEDSRRVLDSLAASRALRRGYPHKVYKLPHENAYAFLTPEMQERDWWKYRDETANSSPVEIWSGINWRQKERRTLLGSIFEYKVTWLHSWFFLAAAHWKPSSLAGRIMGQLQTASVFIEDLTEIGQLFREYNYEKASKVAVRLYNKIGPILGVAVNDVARLLLHTGYYSASAMVAADRLKEAPWELTSHASLLLAHLANSDFESANQHIQQGGPDATPCDYCRAHTAGFIFNQEKLISELDPNALLTASLVLYYLSRDQASQSGDDGMRQNCERALESALLQLAGGWGRGVLTQQYSQQISTALRTEYTDERNILLQGMIWNLDESQKNQEDWKEIESLRRVMLGALGAHLSNNPSSIVRKGVQRKYVPLNSLG